MEYSNTLGNSKDCAWQRYIQSPGTFFEWVDRNEAFTPKFHDTMAVISRRKPDPTIVYPVEQLIRQTKAGQVLLVDVGGGTGNDIEHFRKKLPDVASGSLILQDTRTCLVTTNVHPDIKTMEYDFFTPQPIKGGFVG